MFRWVKDIAEAVVDVCGSHRMASVAIESTLSYILGVGGMASDIESVRGRQAQLGPDEVVGNGGNTISLLRPCWNCVSFILTKAVVINGGISTF